MCWQVGRGTSDGEGLKREADRLAKELREAREREAVLLRELAEGRPKKIIFQKKKQPNHVHKKLVMREALCLCANSQKVVEVECRH